MSELAWRRARRRRLPAGERRCGPELSANTAVSAVAAPPTSRELTADTTRIGAGADGRRSRSGRRSSLDRAARISDAPLGDQPGPVARRGGASPADRRGAAPAGPADHPRANPRSPRWCRPRADRASWASLTRCRHCPGARSRTPTRSSTSCRRSATDSWARSTFRIAGHHCAAGRSNRRLERLAGSRRAQAQTLVPRRRTGGDARVTRRRHRN